MGIQDRDYYRREGPSFLGSLAEQGRVTNWLIGITVLCFILQIVTRAPVAELPPGLEGTPFASMIPKREPFTDSLILDVNKVMHGQVWRLLTCAFLHDTNNIWHIVFNMLILFWFGRQVEDIIGGREFLVFYLTAAVVASLAYVLASLAGLHGVWAPGPDGSRVIYARALGASGAVMAALVLAAMYNPRQVIYIFFVIPMPIWAFIVLMVAVDAFGLLGRTQNGVATSAHLGGAAFGFLYYKLQWRLSGWTYWLRGGRGRSGARRGKPRLRIFEADDESPLDRAASSSSPGASPASASAGTAATGTRTAPLADEHLEAQVDTILEKIQRVGMEGLTESEKQTLLRASEELKRRRS